MLAEHRIGAAVVSEGDGIAGIVSERDVVRHLGDDGGALLDQPVSAIMTADVVTCGPETAVEDLARTMTERRIRHVPVVDAEGALVGIVSIGDVVKSRISELESERDDLVGYIGTRSRTASKRANRAASTPERQDGGDVVGRIRFSCASVAAKPTGAVVDGAAVQAACAGRPTPARVP